MDSPRVMIGIPTAEFARYPGFYDCYEMMQLPPNTGKTSPHGQSPARNRNLIIDVALGNGFTHILFLDDDVVFKPDLLTRLLAHDVDIVTGLYLMRSYPHQPIIFDFANQRGECLTHYLHDDEKGLVEIVACGLGACLIKTSVFAKLTKPYIRLGQLELDHWSDDIEFFKRVREAGIKIHCDLDTLVGHYATVSVWPENIKGEWKTRYESNGSAAVTFPQINPSKQVMERELVNG